MNPGVHLNHREVHLFFATNPKVSYNPLPGVLLATSAVVLAAGVALASRAGLAEGLRSGFLVEGLGLLTRLGSGDWGALAPPNFFTESATVVTVRLHTHKCTCQNC